MVRSVPAISTAQALSAKTKCAAERVVLDLLIEQKITELYPLIKIEC